MLKRIALLVSIFLFLTGCSGVHLSPQYSTLLDRTAALAAESAARAQAGTLPEADQTQVLILQAEVWRQFQDARDGKAGD